MIELNKQKNIIFYLILSILFAFTIQQFPFFQGNSLHLLHAIKNFDLNKLQNDWVANQTNHLPLFTYFNHILLKFLPINILHIVHFFLLLSCTFFIFLICKIEFSNLNTRYISLVWFSVFILVYHEHSFFGGVAGQDIINEGYQPASFGVLFFIGIYLFLINKNYYAVIFICLAASFHPTYVLHSGFLMIGIGTYFFSKKEYKNLFKVLTLYSFLILPITIYIIYNFLLIDKQLVIEGQNILLNRIPHHALIENWFSYKDIFSIMIYVISLFFIFKNKRIFIPLSIFGLISIFVSMVQFLSENQSLAVAFPWRSSVILMPISTMIILSFLIEKYFTKKINTKIIGVSLFIILVSFYFTKNHFIDDNNKYFYKKIEITKKINKNYNSIERLLIPVNLTFIRMNTGLPIFVDWKHFAFKYDEIIFWKKRMNLTESFFESKSYEEQRTNLDLINKIELVSHVLIKKENVFSNCNDLIDDKIYSLINVQECFPQ